MKLTVPLVEILSCKNVPVAIQPGRFQGLGQIVQHTQVIFILLQENLIIVNLGEDKAVIGRVFGYRIAFIDEQTFYPGMPYPSGITSKIKTFGKIIGSPQTGRKCVELIFRKLGGFVNEDDVEFLPLVLQHIRFRITVTKFQAAAVNESEGFLAFFIKSYALQFLQKRQDVVFPQFGVSSAQ